MSPAPAPRAPLPGRVLGLYALAAMERDGPLYGYQFAERVADRTQGGWRPGPGAVYPALRSLTARGLARVQRRGRRRVYSISPQGRRFLTGIRRSWSLRDRQGPDLSALWAEIAGSSDTGQHLLRHLRRHFDSLSNQLESSPERRIGASTLREQVLAEVEAMRARLLALGRPAPQSKGSR